MVTTITPRALAAPDPLTATVQVRFTAAQDELLRSITRQSRRPLSATIRDIVVSWAVNQVNEESSLTDEPPVIDLQACVEELRALAELEGSEP